MLVHGPKSSRRLGRHLVIHNFPHKVCTYSCVYCQGGHTTQLEYERSAFYQPLEIVKEVRTYIAKAKESGETFDYIVYVPDGEPTQDSNLGAEIDHLKKFGIDIAVMTNSSLIWRDDVRSDLLKADLVSLKLDTLNEEAWRKINRPHRSSRLLTIIEGIMEFAKDFKGTLLTETMLVNGLNDTDKFIDETAKFISKLNPSRSYISIPTRKPSESWVMAPDESSINRCYQIFAQYLKDVEYLIGYEFTQMSVLGNIQDDLLAILGQRPMKEEEAKAFILKSDGNVSMLKDLVKANMIVETTHKGNKFLMRPIRLDYKSENIKS